MHGKAKLRFLLNKILNQAQQVFGQYLKIIELFDEYL